MDIPDIGKGDRVRVSFAGKEYIGVVSDTDITPETDIKKIRSIKSVERDMDKVFPEEIDLWRQVADYYLCTVGEVYKAAYPQRKIDLEEARAAALQKAQERHERMLNAMREKIAKLKARLEEKVEALDNAKPGTKKREQLEGMAERLADEISIAEDALAHAEAAQNGAYHGKPAMDTHAKQSEPDITLTPAQEEYMSGWEV